MKNTANINPDLCIGCGMCSYDCPQACFELKENRSVFIGNTCIGCGHCACICPAGAITLNDDSIYDYIETASLDHLIDPETLENFMQTRRSIRHFTNAPVTVEEINALLDAGRYAPTAVNSQDVKYTVVLKEMDKFRDLMWEGYRNLIDATRETNPVRADHLYRRVAALEADPNDDQMVFGAKAAIFIDSSRWALDAGIAAAYIELKAHSMGLGVLFSGYSTIVLDYNAEAAEWLGFTEKKPSVCLLVGHPAVEYKRVPKRKPANVTYK
ncbi:MAG: nitroreductase family protein [Lachnospiraceae bacterium]|nr:nitroreductase family protein [Lachnospiraceae bacterium]